MASTRSSIAIALNGPMVDAPNTKHNKTQSSALSGGRTGTTAAASDAFTSRLAASGGATGSHNPPTKVTRPLPTPPNSISPTIPPARGLAGLRAEANEPDGFDLQVGSCESAFSSAGSITPALLAKHHLPPILLSHGPLAIRHIIGYLTTSVPGFSSIAPAKARRLVVAALEGPRNEGSLSGTGGLDGEVQFDKVGWGRWDARMRGQPPRGGREELSPSPGLPYAGGMPIAAGSANYSNIRRTMAPSSSWTGDFSNEDEKSRDEEGDVDMDVDMEDMDRMSLDGGDESCSSSEAPEEDADELMGDDPEDVTDDEDWAAIGSAALRMHSYNGSAPLGSAPFGGRARGQVQHVYTGGSRSYSYQGAVQPKREGSAKMELLSFQKRPAPTPLGRTSFLAVEDRQERDAVEALLKLGSV